MDILVGDIVDHSLAEVDVQLVFLEIGGESWRTPC